MGQITSQLSTRHKKGFRVLLGTADHCTLLKKAVGAGEALGQAGGCLSLAGATSSSYS